MVRKFTLLFAIAIFTSFFIAAQDHNINKVLKTYFPVNPYKYSFSIFYKKLNEDPAITNKSIQKRTDSTLFSFRGDLSNYKIGDFLFTDAEIKLEEMPVKVPGYNIMDTIILYQLNCYCRGGSIGVEVAKNAFRYFDDNFPMPSAHVKTKLEGGRLTGLVRDYYYPGLLILPVSAGWMELYDGKSAFQITIRMKLHQNFLDIYQDSDIKPGTVKTPIKFRNYC